MDEYLRFARELRLDCMEVSDGSMIIDHGDKCGLIRQMKAQFQVVLSEVGSKVAGRVLPAAEWIRMMQQELESGSSYVIAEAREAGNVGIFNADGSANADLITEISHSVSLQFCGRRPPRPNRPGSSRVSGRKSIWATSRTTR